jgi:hypothetical protein
MADQFRTTVSAVFWTATPDESEPIVAEINAALPEDDRAATLVTIEYIAAGKPVPTPIPPPLEEPAT